MVEWIVSASILIAITIALRALLKGRISLRLQYALWALALLRLLIPFSIGESSLSVMNKATEFPVVQDFESVRDVGEIWRGENGRVEGYPSYVLMPDTPVTVADSKTETEFARMEKTLAFRDIFIPVWLLGAAVILGVFTISNLRFYQRLFRNRREVEAGGASLPVYLTDETSTPCLFGLYRPAIYVTPEAAADKTILRHAVAHETTHYRHGDHIWSLLRVVCLALHWYNPLVWWAALLSKRDGELACDEATVRRIGEGERAEYGRTLIALTCRKPAALLQTATTMTGSRCSITERIVLLAKKPRTAAFTLIAVILIAALAAGCTFTGAKARNQKAFEPDTVRMVQLLSSASPPDPITDPDTVEHLWSIYQSFEFDGKTDMLDKENVWSISVSFINSKSDRAEYFTIHQGGLCRLGDEDTYHVLINGTDIYKEFLNYFEAAKASGYLTQNDLDIAVDDAVNAPGAVVDFARAYVRENIAYYSQLGANPSDENKAYKITDAKITGLEQISTGTAGLNVSINMYLLEYRLKPDHPDYVVLAGGMRMEDGWITEWGSTGQPYLLLFCEDNGTEQVWQRICVTSTDVIKTEYGTPEMLKKYGDAYTAAAMELYLKHRNQQAVSLTPEQIARANEAFTPVLIDESGNASVNPVSCFFTSYYDRAQDINLAEFLRYYPNSHSVTEVEFEALKKHERWPFDRDATRESMPVPIHKYLAQDVNETLLTYAGISLEDLSGVGFDEVLYLEQYDAFYNFTSDFGPGVFNCVRGEVQGDTVRLYAEYGDGSAAMLTLQEQDGKYFIRVHQRIGNK